MNWKVWIHSLVAAAIGGAAAALGAVLVSPASFPDTKQGWAHLAAVGAFGAIVPVLALLKQTPLGSSQTPPAGSNKLPLLLLAVLLLPLGLQGCKPATANTPALAPVPGQLNSFDGGTWRALYAAHEFAKSAVSNASTLTAAQKTALNQFTAALNSADVLYAAYHSGQATEAQMNAAMATLNQQEAAYSATITASTGAK